MRRISTAKLRRWVLVGLGAGALVSSLLGALPIGDYGKGLFLNLGTELIGAVVTYLLLELVIGREAEKADLIARMGSSVKDVAIAAAEELRRHGWLDDGSLQGARLIWANLQGAFLVSANLQGVFLAGANLQKANLKWANLQGAMLESANLQGASLRYTKLQAWLVFANLQGADLEGANLEGASLAGADLQEANLERANLEGARMHGADLQGAKLDKDTILPDGTRWTPDTDMARFINPHHPDFWRPDA